MSKGQVFDFHYSHLLPRKPGVLPLDLPSTKQCRRCGAEFVTRSRAQKRCDACRPVAMARSQAKSYAKQKARRKASREAK